MRLYKCVVVAPIIMGVYLYSIMLGSVG